MAATLEIKPSDELIEPLSVHQRSARGFCTCPSRNADGPALVDEPIPCVVHPAHLLQSQNDLQSRGLVFFDDRRNRFVTWPDAVESMRQPRYNGTSSRGLVLFTWMNLIRLLEALCYPTRTTAQEITEKSAAELVHWAETQFPNDMLRNLIGFARGGGVEALCKIFQIVAQNAQQKQLYESQKTIA